MDKQGIIAVVLAVAVLIGWQYYMGQKTPPTPAAPPPEEQVAASPSPSPNVPDAAAAAASPAASPGASPSEPAVSEPEPETVEERIVTLISKNEKGEPVNRYDFTNRSGGILVAELLKHLGENGENVLLNSEGKSPVGRITPHPGSDQFEGWTIVEQSDTSVVFRRETSPGVSVTKRFTMPDTAGGQDPYTVNVEISYTNAGEQPFTSEGYYFDIGTAKPLHASDWETYAKFDWFTGGSLESIDVNWFTASRIPLIGIQTRAARSELLEQHADISWAAVKDQYFATVLIDPEKKGNRVWSASFQTEENTKAIRGALGVAAFTVPAGETVSHSYTLYLGPKEYSRLQKLGYGIQDAMDFGWFGLFSIFLLKMMNGIYSVVRDYGVAILILTLLIKSALWPLQNKATNSMKRMQALQPKMKELREKYKDDPQRMNTELMKLYKDYGINPFGGCLPMFIQIPIFFGFYRMLGTAEELRNEQFLWVKDLSQPDTVAVIPGVEWPINILPLLMAATMLWQQKLMPKSGDQMQQRVFMFVPLIFVVFCYNFASALALYWTARNIFSVVQLYLTRNKELPALVKVTPPSGGTSGSKKKKK